MFLVVGLGNPGEKYAWTRHNFGFYIVDKFQNKYGFPDFKFLKRADSLVSKKKFSGKTVILAKPQTFMNSSGLSVAGLMAKYKATPDNLLVIHDDIDLSFGRIKISKNRGSAGHKGVESIIDRIGTKDFIRMRLGILNNFVEPKELAREKFVLEEFSGREKELAGQLADKACLILKLIVMGRADEAREIASGKFPA
ncbi:aminoacyl-tRNA hydrolase [bacterium]|nr:aminoacyl-tRNA hydrolase [bacterium]